MFFFGPFFPALAAKVYLQKTILLAWIKFIADAMNCL